MKKIIVLIAVFLTICSAIYLHHESKVFAYLYTGSGCLTTQNCEAQEGGSQPTTRPPYITTAPPVTSTTAPPPTTTTHPPKTIDCPSCQSTHTPFPTTPRPTHWPPGTPPTTCNTCFKDEPYVSDIFVNQNHHPLKTVYIKTILLVMKN